MRITKLLNDQGLGRGEGSREEEGGVGEGDARGGGAWGGGKRVWGVRGAKKLMGVCNGIAF